MSALRRPRFTWRWPSPPIAVQIVALLLAGLVAAQTATLVLTVLLPPAPAAQHSLADIAAGLRGAEIDSDEARPLVRTMDTQPPSFQSPGWVASERSSADLARLLNVDPRDVRLLFYAPPPFAGTESRRTPSRPSPLALLLTSNAYAQTPPPGGFGGPVGAPMGGMDGRGGMGTPGGPMPSGGTWTGGGPGPRPGAPNFPAGGFPGGARPGGPMPEGVHQRRPSPPQGFGRPGPFPGGARSVPHLAFAGQPGPRLNDPLFTAPFRSTVVVTSERIERPEPAAPPAPPSNDAPRELTTDAVATPAPMTRSAPVTEPLSALLPAVARPRSTVARIDPDAGGRSLAAPVARNLFGLSPAPFIEGDFVAALRVGPDRWVTLRPKPEGFPNSWQRRVLMWFALSLAVVAPLGCLFARRLAAPLAGFAAAAERLGRDPSSPVMVGDGPAEVGRAARAFNAMQARLTRYINDRTAMIGAISHDLRTPLARMRFRLERASPALRREIGQDIDQMEAMISSVLAFMRDNAEAGPRHRADLRSILECVVDDAEVTGADVRLEPGEAAEVEVDVLGLQRVFANLIDNAVKYGDSAQVRLRVEGDETIVEVHDHGPGLEPDDLERVFTPFYRGPAARTSSKQGVGLGLATSRSIVRAHGGDIRLQLPGEGLLVQVRLPLARVTPAGRSQPALQAAE
ncbi:sensor histidine kinase [Caulobacter sp. LARHSG274]